MTETISNLKSLNDWLYFLENRHAQSMQLGLDRIKKVAARLNLLHFNAQIVTVGGTNGKGSTVAALESIYHCAGYQVGSYTSPHLVHFNERIRVNLSCISDTKLCEAFGMIEHARENIHLTYFEMATLAALWYFKSFKLDIILLEVGLGGRLDATNIVDSDLAIITTIDLDHQASLGNTQEAIGAEKAGILRPLKPVIYTDLNPPQSIIDSACSLNSPLINLNKDFSFKVDNNEFTITIQNHNKIRLPLPSINLNCAAAAIVASQYLNVKLPILHQYLKTAMHSVCSFGRQSIIPGEITTVLDVAHNPQAARLLGTFIDRYQPKRTVHAVFAALQDKDLCGLIEAVAHHVDYWYPAYLNSKRAASISDLQQAFRQSLNRVPECFTNPLHAYKAAWDNAEPNDVIVVFGSFLTVGYIVAERKLSILQEDCT